MNKTVKENLKEYIMRMLTHRIFINIKPKAGSGPPKHNCNIQDL